MVIERLHQNSVSSKRIWAAIICYQVNASLVIGLVSALRSQVERVLIIDNDARHSALFRLQEQNVTYVSMPSNRGTAGAMNHAWQLGLENGIEFLVCFDQDSEVSTDFIKNLYRQWQALRKTCGPKVCGVGPAWRDRRTGKRFEALKPAGLRRVRVKSDSAECIEVDHLITSGSLVHRDSWLAVGPFDESLFLDYVDIEWSLRARSHGLSFFVTRNAEMLHAIGESVISLFGRSLWVHQPVRQYLLVRNHLLLWRRPYIQLNWKCRDAIQVALKTVLVLALSRPRWQRLGWILRGFRDGLLGRSGPIM